MRKRFFVTVALSILALTSLIIFKTNAQQGKPCPNQVTFGNRRALTGDTSTQSRIEVTYFMTTDPHAFISEAVGVNRSATYKSISTSEYLARMEKLQGQNLASIQKRETATTFLGEMTQVNLERNLRVKDASTVNASHRLAHLSNAAGGLDRETEVGVTKRGAIDGDFYRVDLVSWFISVRRGYKIVDYDSSVLMKPGMTAIFKLTSKDQLSRSGAARNYIAVTLHSVNKVSLESLDGNLADSYDAQQAHPPRPNQEMFSDHGPFWGDKTIQSQVEVTYFTTKDPNTFISEEVVYFTTKDPNAFTSEKAGLNHGEATAILSNSQFLTRLEKMQSEGSANLKKREDAIVFLGDWTEVDLERLMPNGDEKIVNVSRNQARPKCLCALERETEVSVYKPAALDGDSYRVDIVSWFVNYEARHRNVDYDSSATLKPGQTTIVKLTGKDELKRNGSATTYVAVTLYSVTKGNVESAKANHSSMWR